MTQIDVWDDRLQLVIPKGVKVWFDQAKLGVYASEPYDHEGEHRGVVLTLDVDAIQALAPHPMFAPAPLPPPTREDLLGDG